MYQKDKRILKQLLWIPVMTLVFFGAFFLFTDSNQSTVEAASGSQYPHFQKTVLDYYDTVTNSSGTFGEAKQDPDYKGYRTIYYKTGYTLDYIWDEDITTWHENLLGNTVTRHHYVYKTW